MPTDREIEFTGSEKQVEHAQKIFTEHAHKTQPMILNPEQGINKAEFINTVSKVLGVDKVHVATGRKAGREKKSAIESLKVHKHKVKLAAKRDEVNFVESILDNTRTLSIPTKWNPAIVNLNPAGKHFLEEAILQNNLRKIQGFK